MELHRIFWLAALGLISAYALLRGGRPEKFFAIVNVVASFATRFTENNVAWLDPQWGWLVIDAAMLAILFAMAMLTDRAWTLFATSFQLLQITIHGAMVVDNDLRGWAYITALIIFSYLVLFSLGVGTWLHTLDRRYNLHYP